VQETVLPLLTSMKDVSVYLEDSNKEPMYIEKALVLTLLEIMILF
jgi:hypothetical protein